MKFLRILLLPLLSILLTSENQVLSKLDNPHLGVSSVVKHTAKTVENAGVCTKQGGIPKTGPSIKIKPFSTPEQVAKATKKAETVFGKEVKKIIPRERNTGAGKAYQIEFKDGTKIDINPDRVKMQVPKPQNPRPGGMGKHDFIKDGGLPEGTKVVVEGTKTLPHKRTLTESERKLLEDLLVE